MGDRTAGSFMSMGHHGRASSKGSASKVPGREAGKCGMGSRDQLPAVGVI